MAYCQISIMKNNKILFFFFFTSLGLGCKKNEKEGKNSWIAQEWRKDSIGCNGMRALILKNYAKEIESHTGEPYADFVSDFGNPNFFKYDHKGDVILYYFVECGMLSDRDLAVSGPMGYDKNAMHLIIRTDLNNKIVDIYNVTP